MKYKTRMCGRVTTATHTVLTRSTDGPRTQCIAHRARTYRVLFYAFP